MRELIKFLLIWTFGWWVWIGLILLLLDHT